MFVTAPDPRLDPALRAVLCRRAAAWAAAVAPGRARMLDPGEPVAAAVEGAFARQEGPVLLAASDAPRLSADHAAWALADLADGADASVGPGMDGCWYLAALAAPHGALLRLLAETPAGEEVMGRVLAVAAEAGLEVGMLRMERLLRTARDRAALAVDPLTPDAVRTALRRSG